jgi:hypothetical protein
MSAACTHPIDRACVLWCARAVDFNAEAPRSFALAPLFPILPCEPEAAAAITAGADPTPYYVPKFLLTGTALPPLPPRLPSGASTAGVVHACVIPALAPVDTKHTPAASTAPTTAPAASTSAAAVTSTTSASADQKHATRYTLQQALALYQSEAEAGNPSAMVCYGWCHQFAQGVPKDAKRAFALYSRAQALGSAVAQNNVAVCWLRGVGVDADERKAVQLLRAASEQGCAMAHCNYGTSFIEGWGGQAVAHERAIPFYEKAVLAGHPFGYHNVAFSYASGEGVPQDAKLATDWMAVASALGYAPSQVRARHLFCTAVLCCAVLCYAVRLATPVTHTHT